MLIMKYLFLILLLTFNFGFSQTKKIEIVNQVLLLKLINDARSEPRKCGNTNYEATKPMIWNLKLECAAQNHSLDMNKKSYFDHTSKNGKKPWDRAEKCGYSYQTIAENIAYSSNGVENDIIIMWLESPGHCANIMDPNHTEFGVGKSGIYWTQVLASPIKP